ncbi:MAG: hypothetical protein MR446_08625 [Bacteroidales bacterium]|nr:hypothetical protein [Bacteroidales bacterium]
MNHGFSPHCATTCVLSFRGIYGVIARRRPATCSASDERCCVEGIFQASPANLHALPENFQGTLVNVESMPENVGSMPVNIESTPVNVGGMPVNVESTPVNVESTPAGRHYFQEIFQGLKKFFQRLKKFFQRLKKNFQPLEKNFQASPFFLKIAPCAERPIGDHRGAICEPQDAQTDA